MSKISSRVTVESLKRTASRARRGASASAVAAAVICLALILLSSACGEPPRYAKSGTPDGELPTAQPRANLPMPPVATAHDAAAGGAGGWTKLDGRRESVEDYRGRVLVLDFYATYCPPCREEIPHLLSLRRRFGPQGLEVVGLNVGGERDQREVPAFVEDLAISYPLGNPDASLVDALFAGETAIPQTYVFDRRGRLVERVTGFDPTIAARLETAVEKAVTRGE